MFITCDPDPVSGTQGFEIWLNRKDKIKGFEKKQMNGSNLLPKGAGRVSFGDFGECNGVIHIRSFFFFIFYSFVFFLSDGDGAMDLIFPVCPSGSPDDCFIQILYNRQAPLCQQPTSIFSSISSTADPVYDGKTGALVCRGLQSLCLADDSFSFDDQVVRREILIYRSHCLLTFLHCLF